MQLLQQAFDRAATGVITQGQAATDFDGTCQYGTAKMACGVGQLMVSDDVRRTWDDKYGAIADLGEVWWDTHKDVIEHAGLAGLPMDFLIALQAAHDDPNNDKAPDYVAAFKVKMQKLARSWKLNPQVVQ